MAIIIKIMAIIIFNVRINNRYFRYMSSTKRLNVCSFFRIFVGYVGKKLYLCSVEPKNGADLS